MLTSVARTRLERDGARILAGVDARPSAAPVLLVLTGLPGTGKTHIANELARRTNAVVLESDAVRTLLFRERRYTRPENRRVFAALHAATDVLLAQGSTVIVDATNVAERERAPLYEIAERRSVRLILVHVTAQEQIARERLERRRAGGASHSQADVGVYERMLSRVERIQRPHYAIDTSENIEPALDALAKEMMQP